MGWDCYKHEVNVESKSWEEKILNLITINCYPRSKNSAICPWCYEELANELYTIKRVIEEAGFKFVPEVKTPARIIQVGI